MATEKVVEFIVIGTLVDVSNTDNELTLCGVATIKFEYMVPVFNVNGFEPFINILLGNDLTCDELVGTELVGP